jgi:RNA-directed DNA polymerase
LSSSGCETGTGQGQPISPLLANIFLHYILDEWFENEVKPRLKGEAYEIRFADDAILCFQHKEDAEKVLGVLPKRFEKYGLTLHPEKTRRIEFGRYAPTDRKMDQSRSHRGGQTARESLPQIFDAEKVPGDVANAP